MSNDKANAAYHGAPGDDTQGAGGFRDQGDNGWGTREPWHHEYQPLKPVRTAADKFATVATTLIMGLCLVVGLAVIGLIGYGIIKFGLSLFS